MRLLRLNYVYRKSPDPFLQPRVQLREGILNLVPASISNDQYLLHSIYRCLAALTGMGIPNFSISIIKRPDMPPSSSPRSLNSSSLEPCSINLSGMPSLRIFLTSAPSSESISNTAEPNPPARA